MSADKISEHISPPNRGYCVSYPSNIYLKELNKLIWLFQGMFLVVHLLSYRCTWEWEAWWPHG